MATSLAGKTAIVTGASKGFGRAIATELTAAGMHVVGVARNKENLVALQPELGDLFTPVVADAADGAVAGHMMDKYDPDMLVLNAGATPLSRSIHHLSWDTFSRNWHTDVAQAFHWTREALLRPMRPGSTVVAMSSGAALGGSPVSGGYAGSKATVRFIAQYAADESNRLDLGIRFLALMPWLTPDTDTGKMGVAAYARRQGITAEELLADHGPTMTPDQVGKTVLEFVSEPDAYEPGAYVLRAEGLSRPTLGFNRI